jgi:hypothetical protein
VGGRDADAVYMLMFGLAGLDITRLPLHTACMAVFMPSLRVFERDGRVRLALAGFGHADGATLQEAADELVRRVLVIAMAVRAGDVCPRSTECMVDPAQLAFIWELGLIAASGGDIRGRLFGPEGTHAA